MVTGSRYKTGEQFKVGVFGDFAHKGTEVDVQIKSSAFMGLSPIKIDTGLKSGGPEDL